VHVSATVPADEYKLSDSNNNELFIINLATVPADGILLSRLHKAVPLVAIIERLQDTNDTQNKWTTIYI